MLRIRDYTKVAVGTKIQEGEFEGEIRLCPYCGKNGLAADVNGKTFFTHQERLWFSETGPVMDSEWCPRLAVPKFQTEVRTDLRRE